MGTSVLQPGSFKVFDEGGRPFVVDEYAEVVEEGTLSFPGAELEGLREYRLGDEPCNAERDGSFVVVRTGQRLRRAPAKPMRRWRAAKSGGRCTACRLR